MYQKIARSCQVQESQQKLFLNQFFIYLFLFQKVLLFLYLLSIKIFYQFSNI